MGFSPAVISACMHAPAPCAVRLGDYAEVTPGHLASDSAPTHGRPGAESEVTARPRVTECHIHNRLVTSLDSPLITLPLSG